MAKTEVKNGSLDRLKRDLAEGLPSGLYIFYGEEDYLREYYLEELRKRLTDGPMESFNLQRLQGKGLSVLQLEQAVDCLPMMNERTLIVVRDFDLYKTPEGDREQLIHLLTSLPAYCCLVFCYDVLEYKPDRRTKLYSALSAHVREVRFERQEQNSLVRWIARRFSALGKEISPVDAEYLIFLCGGLMTGLAAEIEKIGAFSKGKRIARTDIDAVTIPVLDANVFRMTDAVLSRNYNTAARLLDELLRMQQPPILILAVLGKQMRQLYSAKLALSEGRGPSYLAELWDMKSTWGVKRMFESARSYSAAWCRRAVILCAQADADMKSGKTDDREVLLSLLPRLAAIG